MPIKIQNDLPARAILESENVFIMDETRASSQDIRPLEILILNLMPLKEDTETQLLRALSNTPLQVECTYMIMSTHESTHTSASHLNKFYVTFQDVKNRRFDGMIITGAPVELMEYEEVNYWEELKTVMEWSRSHVTSTMHLCWGAQAGLYYHYGIPKYKREEKLSGIYTHRTLDRKVPLMRSFDDTFHCPHSRYTEVREEDILKHPELKILARSEEAGVFLVMNRDGSQIFVQGHPEYDRMTLNAEYHRDLNRGLDPALPRNYYDHDDPFSIPPLTWRNMANTLYCNWLNFYVYQVTPYDLYKEPSPEVNFITALPCIIMPVAVRISAPVHYLHRVRYARLFKSSNFVIQLLKNIFLACPLHPVINIIQGRRNFTIHKSFYKKWAIISSFQSKFK